MSYINPSFNALELQGRPLDGAAPSNNQAIMWDGAKWLPETMDASEVNNDSTVSGSTVKDALETLSSAISNPPLVVVSTATSRTMDAADDVQLVTAGGQTITLVSAVTKGSGAVVFVKRSGSGGGNTIVDAAGSETIDGNLTKVIGNDASVMLVSDGSNWHII